MEFFFCIFSQLWFARGTCHVSLLGATSQPCQSCMSCCRLYRSSSSHRRTACSRAEARVVSILIKLVPLNYATSGLLICQLFCSAALPQLHRVPGERTREAP